MSLGEAENSSLRPLEFRTLKAEAPKLHILLRIIPPPTHCFLFLLFDELLAALSLCVANLVLGTAEPPRGWGPIVRHAWHQGIEKELSHVMRFAKPVEVGRAIAIAVESLDAVVKFVFEE